MTDALMYTDTNGDAHVVGVMSDVVNNLTSTSTTSALSAYQGKVLNDKITSSIYDPISTHATINGASKVSKSGNIVLVNLYMTTTENVSGFTEIANVPLDCYPSQSRNIFCTYSIGGVVRGGQIQVLDTGVIRFGEYIASGNVVIVEFSYAI